MKRSSAILKSLAHHQKSEVTIGDLVKESGSRKHGLGLLVFALPEALPLPLPSLGLILAVPLILLSGHLVLFGESGGVPSSIKRRTIRVSILQKVASYVVPFFEKLEHVSRPRLEVLARRERLLGLACLFLSVILLLPIPFGNVVPAMCLVAIAFGMLQRDGAIVALGLIATAVLMASLLYLTMRFDII